MSRVATLQWHNGKVNTLVGCPGNLVNYLLSASVDGTIAVWNTKNHKNEHILVAHELGVKKLAYEPRSRMMASIGHGKVSDIVVEICSFVVWHCLVMLLVYFHFIFYFPFFLHLVCFVSLFLPLLLCNATRSSQFPEHQLTLLAIFRSIGSCISFIHENKQNKIKMKQVSMRATLWALIWKVNDTNGHATVVATLKGHLVPLLDVAIVVEPERYDFFFFLFFFFSLFFLSHFFLRSLSLIIFLLFIFSLSRYVFS